MKLVSSILFLALCILGCEREYYRLNVSIAGNGTYEITSQKNEYEEGETVTLTAIADLGWKFRRWDGSTLSSKSNPLSLVMDGHKNIQLVFDKPIEPDLTGIWLSKQWAIAFDIEQPDQFEELRGKMTILLSNGLTLVYNITGLNNSPQVRMTCSKSGYYEIYFNGMVENDNLINGRLIEEGLAIDCDLQRYTDSPLSVERLPFEFKKLKEAKQ
jgi:hypothetical protein